MQRVERVEQSRPLHVQENNFQEKNCPLEVLTNIDGQQQAPASNNNSASISTSKKPRRRRLARRRQYTKSRRLASSYLRSQFVRYDSNQDSTNSNEADQEHHEHHHQWWLPQLKRQVATSDEHERCLLSAKSDGSHEADCELEDDGDDETLSTRADVGLLSEQQRVASRLLDGPAGSSSSSSRFTLLSLQPDEQFIRQTTQAKQKRQQQQQQHHQTAKLHSRLPAPPPLPARRRNLTQVSGAGNDRVQQQSSSFPVQQQASSVVAYSSSSLDSASYSPASLNTGRSTSAAAFRSGQPPSVDLAAAVIDSSICRRSPATRLPPALVARSLVSLDNVGKTAALATKSTKATVAQLQQLPSTLPNEASLQSRLASSSDRVVRSETIDLNRVSWQQPQVSPRIKFFQQQQLVHERQQQAFNFSYDSSSATSISGLGLGSSADAVCAFPLERLQPSKHSTSSNVAHPPQRASSIASAGHQTPAIRTQQFMSVQQSVERNYHPHLVHQKENVECIDNVHFNDLFHGTVTDSSSSIAVNQSVRTDPRLHKDDVDIKFSRALNSCKLPQIRYASKERLFERLTDLRFLSIDFLNTFLLTYRVFTTAEDVLEALKSVHYNGGERIFGGSASSFAGTQVSAPTTAATNQQQQRRPDSMYSMSSSSMTAASGHQQDSQQMSSQSQQHNIAAGGSNSAQATPLASPKLQTDQKPSQQTSSPGKTKRRPPPPSIPLASQHQTSGSNKISSSSGHQTQLLDCGDQNRLLAPGQHQLSQKRRSTISSLTPITGSNSSSLVNLSAAAAAAAVAAAATTNKSGASLRYDDQVSSPASSEQAGDNKLTKSRPNMTRNSTSSAAFCSSDCDQDHEHELMSNQFDSMRQTFCETDDEEANISPGLLVGLVDGHRIRSASVSIQSEAPDAFYSASSGNLNISHQSRPPAASAKVTKQHAHSSTLMVPGSRQARASSLSHVGFAADSARTVAGMRIQHQHQHRPPDSGAPREHWRLSYKKNQQPQQKGQSTTIIKSPSAANPSGGLTSSTINQNNFLNPNSALLLSTSEFQLMPERRKSAADVDNIRLQVTLVEPIQQQQTCASSEQNLASTTITSGGSNPSLTASNNTQQEQQTGQEANPQLLTTSPQCSSRYSTKSNSPLVPPCTPVGPLSATGSSSGASPTPTPKRDKSPVRDELSSHQLRRSVKNRHHQRHRRSHLSNSSDDWSSENGEQAISSSSPDQSKNHSLSHEFDQEEQQLLLTNPSSAQKARRSDKSLLESHSNRRKLSLAAKRQQMRQDSLLLKGIDLTTRNAVKLLDCDTSADETEAESSCSDDSADSIAVSEQNGEHESADKDEEEERDGFVANADKDHTADSQQQVVTSNGKLVQDEDSSKMIAKSLNDLKLTSAASYEGPTIETKSEQASLPAANMGQDTSSSVLANAGARPARVPVDAASGASISCLMTPRSSFQHTATENLLNSRAGVVVTSKSPRVSSRRSSTASAASAFAAATAASCNPLLTQPPQQCMLTRSNQLAGMGQIKSPNELAAGKLHCTCGLSMQHQQQQQQQQQYALATIQATSGSQQQLHRGSISSIQMQHNHNRRPTIQQNNTSQQQHAPHCQLQQQQHQFNYQSDVSSISLCNSRASSRLSSCAGLEMGSQQHPQNSYMISGKLPPGGGSQLAGSSITSGSARGSCQSSAGIQSFARFAGSQANLGYHHHHHQNNQMALMSKRNSSASGVCGPQSNQFRSMATLRVLSVLRHWVSKHSQDFVNDPRLANLAQEFLQDLIIDSSLLPAEHKAAIQLQQMIQKATHSRSNQVDLDVLLAPPSRPSPDSIETLSALEIAEGMTYLDHKIFLAIKSEEFLGQAWMKSDKAIKAPHILLITKRFNDVSRLVSSEIIRVPELHRRVAIIEKWTNVAHICRVIHNFNGVLQICAAFTNSSVFRLKKTWDKIPKTTKATIDQLQNLVSTDSRFRNMRDAINRCDPPSIPYVGMYLTDLSFIEEGTPNYSPEGLLNFSKMRMIAHVIREIQHLQNGVYKMELNPRVANYLLDASRHLQDDEMYRCSLAIEPRSSGAKNGVQLINSMGGSSQLMNHSGTGGATQQAQSCTPTNESNPTAVGPKEHD